jgi:hypothetical protein
MTAPSMGHWSASQSRKRNDPWTLRNSNWQPVQGRLFLEGLLRCVWDLNPGHGSGGMGHFILPLPARFGP